MDRRRFLQTTGSAAGLGGLAGIGAESASAWHTQDPVSDRFVAADSSNYSSSDRGAADIDWILIHYTVGSYDGAISWFQNADANVSAHYVIKTYDDWQDWPPGHITQMVHHEDVAWHASGSNNPSIGIEHEWYDDGPVDGFSQECYQASAQLVVELAEMYDIPLEYYFDHNAMCDQPGGIIGHRDSTANSWCGEANTTDCPGPWDADEFMYWVNHYADDGGSAAFSVHDWSVDPGEVEPGEPTSVDGYVHNHGDAADDVPVEFYLNGNYADTQWVYDLSPDESAPVSFAASEDDLGEHDLWVFEFYESEIGDDWEGTFEVVEDSDEVEIELSGWGITPAEVEPDEPVTIAGNVENVGGETDDVPIDLWVGPEDEDTEYQETVWLEDLAPGDVETVEFEHAESEEGGYDVTVVDWHDENVDDSWSGGFEVVAETDEQFGANERVAATEATTARESPGDGSTAVGDLDAGDEGSIRDGPEWADDGWWWELYAPSLGSDGWVRESHLRSMGRYEFEEPAPVVWVPEEETAQGRDAPGGDLVVELPEFTPARVINGPEYADDARWWGLHVPGRAAWVWVTQAEIEPFPAGHYEEEGARTVRGTVGWTGDDQVVLGPDSDVTVQDGPLVAQDQVFWSTDPDDVGGWWWVREDDLETTDHPHRDILPFDTLTNLNDPVEIDVDDYDPGTAIDLAIETIHHEDSPLSGSGEDFVLAGERLGMNALYIVAHAAHESAWGTSLIAQDKYNLFGWGAEDDDPYESALEYDSFADCIYTVGAQIKHLYLTPGNWRYQGPHLEGMNEYYATDDEWAEKIAETYDDLATIIDEEAFDPQEPPEPAFEKGDVVVTMIDTNGHEEPGQTTEVIAELEADTEAEVLVEEPELIDMAHWWKLDVEGLDEDVWAVEGDLELVTAGCHLAGDVDGDGEVTSMDATMTLRYIAGLSVSEDFDESCADVTGDGSIEPADVTAIQQIIVGLEDPSAFPLEDRDRTAGSATVALSREETSEGRLRVSLVVDAPDVAGYRAALAFDPDALDLRDVDGGDFGDPTVNVDAAAGTVGLAGARAEGVADPTLAVLEFAVRDSTDAVIELLPASVGLNDSREAVYETRVIDDEVGADR